MGGSVPTVKKNAEALLAATKEIGLEVNAHKTKYMTVSRDQNAGRIHSMKMDNSSIETHVNPVIFSRRTLFHGVSKQVNTDVTNKLLHK